MLQDNAICYAASEGLEVVAVCVITIDSPKLIQLCNISVHSKYRAKGIGSKLLKWVLDDINTRGIGSIELGTGSFDYQLGFYPKKLS